MATYSIVGAGGSTDNPIYVFAGCDDTTVVVCWTVRITADDNCGVKMYRDEKYCDEGSVNSNTLTWETPNGNFLTIYYSVKKPSDCNPQPPGCTFKCTNLTAYAVPGSVAENYSGDIDVHYEYLLECYGTKTGIKTVPFSSFRADGESYKYTYTTSDSDIQTQCSTDVIVHKKGKDDCTEGCVADVSISFSQNVVPASGKTIQVIVSFKKTVTDKNCNKKVTTGSFSYPWEVKCTPVDENDKHCCKDHYVEDSISIATIKERAKLGDCELRYEGEQTAFDLYYKVLQKGKTTEECEGYCEEKTTYCVDSGSVKVCYETNYLSDKWVCDGESYTDCDCGALSIGGHSVPFTGGRIKVKWDYSAHTITENCTEYNTTGGTWEEIITIGGCDERPVDCKTEYNTVVIDKEGHTAAYDNDTFQGCQVCDSECCYNYDGNGTCRCVILFKEQTPECKTCESCTVWDDEEQRQITYNKIRYEFVQDCTNICDYTKSTKFNKQTKSLDKCFVGESAVTADVQFTSTTEYHGAGCPAPETKIGTVSATANVKVSTPNSSNKERVIYEDDMIKVVQPGYCETPSTDCDCYSLTIEGQSPTPPGPTPTINCICELHGTRFDYNKYPSAGSNGTLKKVGTYELKSGCSGDLEFDKIVPGGDNKSTAYKIWNSTSDFKFEDGYIWAAVPKNNTSGVIHIHCHFKCKANETDSETDYINFYQEAGSGGGGETSCICNSLKGVFSSDTNKYPSAGSGEVMETIGTYSISSECGGTLEFDKIVPGSNNESPDYNLWNKTSDFDIKNGEIKAAIPRNSTNGMIHIHCHFKCKTDPSASDTDYINFYQAAGSEPQPADCDEPNPNQGLDTMIRVLTKGTPLSGKINHSDTPCTYTHLLHAWREHGGLNERGSWFMANIFSELTPVKEDSTQYFKNAANEYGHICKDDEDFLNYEKVYNNRIDGGVNYADYKRRYYNTSQEYVRKARTELVSITRHAEERISGTSIPSAIDSPLKCGDLTYFNQGSPDLLAVVPRITSTSCESKDWERTQNLITGCPSPTDSCAKQAKEDDTYEMSYFCKILGVSEDEYSDYLLFTTDIVDDITNRAKDSVSRYRPYGENCIKISSSNGFKCGDEPWTACSNTFGDCTLYLGSSPNGTNPDDTNSYPSGHASKGFMAYLVLLEKTDVLDKRTRIDEYCYNRAKLRAHWESDVIVGKLAASMVIGYLNGFSSFHRYLSSPKCVKKHSNKACGCDCGFDIPTGC